MIGFIVLFLYNPYHIDTDFFRAIIFCFSYGK